MATTLPANTFALLDGSTTLGDGAGLGEDGIGTGEIGGNDTFSGRSNLPFGGYEAIGDSWSIYEDGKGGNDRFVGGSNVGQAATTWDDLMYIGGEDGGVLFVGDANVFWDEGAGGNDSMTGGNNSASWFMGDAGSMYDNSTGGRDSLKGGNSTTSTTTDVLASNLIIGDAYWAAGEDYLEDGGVDGGADSLSGGNASTTATGLTAGDAGTVNGLVGDFMTMNNSAVRGGNDNLAGGNANARAGIAEVVNWMVGDGEDMYGASGGNDTLRLGGATLTGNGEAYAFNLAAGDADWMSAGSAGGNDTMIGGNFADGSTAMGDGYTLNAMAGDTWSTGYLGEDFADMGDDKLTGGSATSGTDGYVMNVMYGDVGDDYFVGFFRYDLLGGYVEPTFTFSDAMPVGALYGNDSLTGGSGRADNFMMGDAEYIGYSWAETGGNDTITGGGAGSYNVMFGDGYELGAYGTGGNDRLVSAAGEDTMYGDADYMAEGAIGGADTFVFRFGNGDDEIMDFRLDDGDVIDISAMRTIIGSFAKLESQGRIVDDGDGNAMLLLGRYTPGSDTLVLNGVAPGDVTAEMFIF